MLVLATVASAQATLIVGPGGFATIQAAIDAAANGDIVVVRPGSYTNFSCNRGLTIRGDGTGAVSVSGPFLSLVQLAVGQRFTLADLRFEGLLIAGGIGNLDRCEFTGTQTIAVTATRLVMQDCAVTPSLASAVGTGQAAFVAINSEVHAAGGSFVGPDQQGLIGAAGSGLSLINSRFHGADLVLRGGSPGTSGQTPPPAVLADSTSWLWVTDSVVTAAPAACAINATQGGHDRCSLTPNCSTLPAAPLLGVRRTQPIRRGQTFQLEFRAQPSVAVGLWTDIGLGSATDPRLLQTVLLPPATATPLIVLVTDAAGNATPSWSVPNSPLLLDREVWFQAVTPTTMPFPLSPVAGGLIR
jgi:hypothetical protein